jgi:excinuclease ABC subunit A
MKCAILAETYPSTGISYQNPEPNLFSFNLGACAHCNGLGTVNEINVKKDNLNPGYLSKGGFAPFGEYKSS